MTNIEKLEFKKLLAEHEFYTSDLEYKTELMKVIQNQFMEIVEKKLNNKKDDYNKIIDLQKISMHQEAEEKQKQETPKQQPSKYEKELFRKISKLTHPDKNPELDQTVKELYAEASNAYTEHDVVKLNQIAKKLNIDFDTNQFVIDKLKIQISTLINETKIIEQNISWKWYNAKTKKAKSEFINLYIKGAVNHNMT